MSSAKQYDLPTYPVIPLQAVIGTIISAQTNLIHRDNVLYQCVWTGTLVGTFSVQTSNDYTVASGVGTWDTVPLTAGAVAAGSPDHGTIELNQLSAPWIQITFTYTSGAGNLTVTISGKAV